MIGLPGGAENSTLFCVLYLFDNAFRDSRMGYASALAWLLFVIIMIVIAVQFAAGRYWVFYQQET